MALRYRDVIRGLRTYARPARPQSRRALWQGREAAKEKPCRRRWIDERIEVVMVNDRSVGVVGEAHDARKWHTDSVDR